MRGQWRAFACEKMFEIFAAALTRAPRPLYFLNDARNILQMNHLCIAEDGEHCVGFGRVAPFLVQIRDQSLLLSDAALALVGMSCSLD